MAGKLAWVRDAHDNLFVSLPLTDDLILSISLRRNTSTHTSEGYMSLWKGQCDVTEKYFYFENSDFPEIPLTAHNLWALLDVIRNNVSINESL